MNVKQYANPEGFVGGQILRLMNFSHKKEWKVINSKIHLYEKYRLMDIGCGGGGYINMVLKDNPNISAVGIDVSEKSVEFSQKINKDYLKTRCSVLHASVIKIPFPDNSFDVITSFANISYWPNIEKGFYEISRVLEKDGLAVIDCSVCLPDYQKFAAKYIGESNGFHLLTQEDIQAVINNLSFQSVDWVKITHSKNNNRLYLFAIK